MATPRVRLARKTVRGDVYWFAEWNEPNPDGGRALRRSLALGVKGDDRRDEAQELLEGVRVSLRQSPDVTIGARMAVGEFAEMHLATLRRSVRASTHVHYTRYTHRFVASVGADRPLDEITPMDIEVWIREMEAAGQSPRSINLALAAVGAMLRRAEMDEVISKSPMRRVRKARVPADTFPPYITPALYLEAVDPLLPSPRMQLACRLALFAGLRQREVAHLEWADVDLVREEIRIVSRGEGRETKSGRGRVVPLLPPVREALLALPRTDRFIFPSGGTRRHVGERVSAEWTRTVRRLAAEDPRVPVITFHGLRHSFATWMASSGLPLASLQVVLGHADIAMTMRYVHVQPQTANEQVRLIASSALPSMSPAPHFRSGM